MLKIFRERISLTERAFRHGLGALVVDWKASGQRLQMKTT